MKFLNVIGTAVNDAVTYVVEKNNNQAQLNRLRMTIKNEAQLMDKTYIALGKYYYENMKDLEEDENNKYHFEVIDNSKERMAKAVKKYKELANANACEESCCCDCECESDIKEDEDITVCCAYDDETLDNNAQEISVAVKTAIN